MNKSMTTSDLLRNKLFQNYSDNLKIVTKKAGWRLGYQNDKDEFEEPSEAYICPICSKLFVSESLDQHGVNPLTLEDVPPKKLGGKPIILTCKSCNNTIGGKQLDSKLIWDQEVEPFFKRKPNSQIKTYYEINERTKAKGRLTYLGEKGYKISFNPKTNPNLNKELDYVIKNWDKTSIKFSFQAPDKKIVLLAILKIAYLKMFSVFGYGYYFNYSSRIIREQLFDITKDLIPNFGISSLVNWPTDAGEINFVTSPKEFRSFLVLFNINFKGNKKIYAVLIPGPNEECLNLYSNIKDKKNNVLNLFQLPQYNYLTDTKYIFSYTNIWKDFNK